MDIVIDWLGEGLVDADGWGSKYLLRLHPTSGVDFWGSLDGMAGSIRRSGLSLFAEVW